MSPTATAKATASTSTPITLPDVPSNFPALEPVLPDPQDDAGRFLSGKHTEGKQMGRYWLYVPPSAGRKRLPLVVMLHGCKQDPEDFAAGTAMNERARETGFFVLYPEQPGSANFNHCWNWFSPRHQQRGSGEPALLAGITRKIIKQRNIDPRRVYIAGMSAGGAMAATMAAAYPDLYAAAGVHSGLPTGAASNIADAFTAMRSGARDHGHFALRKRKSSKAVATGAEIAPVPTIVFHGDADRTVHPRNGELVLAAALGGPDAETVATPRSAEVETGASAQGTRFSRSTHHDDEGRVLAESWVVHGAGHAWSGGDPSGSYTDAAGPDATREMLRFFLAHPMPDRSRS